MTRLNIVAEGQTEEAFVNNILVDHLANFGVYANVRCVETGRDKKIGKIYRGGISKYAALKKDIELWIKQDNNPDAWVTTMIDLYALPDDFPGYLEAIKLQNPYKLVEKLEGNLKSDISHQRFLPYIQLHEFEALLLADPGKLIDFYFEYPSAIHSLKTLVSRYSSPELINQGRETAPSKRIIQNIPEYLEMKVTVGPVVAGKIGLVTLRNKCLHFHQWLSKLETLR